MRNLRLENMLKVIERMPLKGDTVHHRENIRQKLIFLLNAHGKHQAVYERVIREAQSFIVAGVYRRAA